MNIGGGLTQSPFAPQQRIMPFVNKSGEVIPPHAAMKLKKSRASEDSSHKAYKPEKDDDPFVVFNGPLEVESEAEGYCSADYPLWAAYNSDDGPPANGESLGTRAGFWELHRGYEGFLVWGGADEEKVFVQIDVTCREAGTGLYYSSSGLPSNPVFLSSCYSCDPPLMLPSVLCANHTGSTAHDSGFFLKRWNGGYYHPVPWLPTWATQITVGGMPFTYPGWYSDLIEDFVCEFEFEFSDENYHYHTIWTDTYYYFYSYNLGSSPEQCTVTMTQFVVREGTLTRTSLIDSSETIFDLDANPMNASSVGGILEGGVCGPPSCDPFSVIVTMGHFGPPPDSLKVKCACPTYDPATTGFGLGGHAPPTGYPCVESEGSCTGGAGGVSSGSTVEVFICSGDVPPWFPPPYKDAPGFQSSGDGESEMAFQEDAFQTE